jgi:hypothetical protein
VRTHETLQVLKKLDADRMRPLKAWTLGLSTGVARRESWESAILHGKR